MKKGCFNCYYAWVERGICDVLGCPTLTEQETAENFQCEYWRDKEEMLAKIKENGKLPNIQKEISA